MDKYLNLNCVGKRQGEVKRFFRKEAGRSSKTNA